LKSITANSSMMPKRHWNPSTIKWRL